MNVCFPTQILKGLDSELFGHFGSATGFILVNTDSMTVEELSNNDAHHQHGMCQPLKALAGRMVDAIVVGGIGMGALIKLSQAGVQVFRGIQGTVAENLEMLTKGTLPRFEPGDTCAGHAGGGCGHTH